MNGKKISQSAMELNKRIMMKMGMKNLRLRILYYGIISVLITAVTVGILWLNIDFIWEILGLTDRQVLPYREEIRTQSIQLLVLSLVGVVVFLASFLLQMDAVIQYVNEITKGIYRIADGDLETIIEPKGEDELTYIANSLNDMTGKLKDLMEKERIAERTKNELITNVAHDLRTPLTSIIGYMGFLSADDKLEESVRKRYIEIVYQKAKRLEKLIEDLFSFTKLNYGKIAMKVEQVDLVMLLNQLLDDFYPSFENHNLTQEFLTNQPVILLEGDGSLLARLFDNLINNAIKYGSEGKVIRVEIEEIQEQVVVKVINYGYIIPQKDLELIFNKFYRVEQSRSENTGGTGLGLAIVKNIVDMHHGRISVKSSLDGTEFEVVLNKVFQAAE
ncbi:MAG: HAMP domain-containing sensor histidine kinase [Lachnospiraceae bacterium]|nr:HAMP domain-containing sensor histidine kinase [Lachnospiraceae bacterium]